MPDVVLKYKQAIFFHKAVDAIVRKRWTKISLRNRNGVISWHV